MIAWAMRTANRAPKPNYLRATLTGLAAQGFDLTRLHLAVTAPKLDWLERALEGLSTPRLIVPAKRIGANENGLEAMAAACADGQPWIAVLEDDLVFCADFAGSCARWLQRHQRPDRHVYRCFGFTTPPRGSAVDAYDWPLASLRGSQVFLLRTDDALDCIAWGRAHLRDWVRLAPWGRKYVALTDPTIGFDKLIATWALLRWPNVPGVMTHPYFVQHVGDQSSLHSKGIRNDKPFAGRQWRYDPAGEASGW